MKKAITVDEMIDELKYYVNSDIQDYPEEEIKQMYEEFWRKMWGIKDGELNEHS